MFGDCLLGNVREKLNVKLSFPTDGGICISGRSSNGSLKALGWVNLIVPFKMFFKLAIVTYLYRGI